MQPSPTAMQGRTCLITGATSGLGLATARVLAQQGAHVVIVGRDPARAAATLAELRTATGNPRIESLVADLSSQQQIRMLAGQILETCPHLDVLVNNVGGAWFVRGTTVDGHERTVAVNHLGPFLLTNLLLDRLKANPTARIVNVSSEAHRIVSLHWDDLMARRFYRGYLQYARSKLMNLLFTYELSRKLEGTGVTVNALHPGWVATGILRNFSWLGKFWAVVSNVFAVTPEVGAKTEIYLASSPEVAGVSGKYFSKERPIESSKASYDEKAAKRLWEVSLELTNQ